jgi:hypothetical protein
MCAFFLSYFLASDDFFGGWGLTSQKLGKNFNKQGKMEY